MRFSSLLLLLLPVAFAASANPSPSFDGCAGFVDTLPASLSKPGVWCLRADLATPLASGAAVTIAAHNVTLDCNGYTLRNLSPAATAAVAVVAASRNAVQVRACHVRDFHTGMSLSGLTHVVEDNRFEKMSSAGVLMTSDGARIARNGFVEIGVPGTPGALYRGIQTVGDVDILDNELRDVVGSLAGKVVAIHNQAGQANVIARNRVYSVHNAGSGSVSALQVGIGNAASRSVVQDNVLVATAPGVAGTGLTCGSKTILTIGNRVHGYSTPWSPACVNRGNIGTP